MEIRRLRVFRTIVETGTVSRAAELLHVTPGALSKTVRQLEQEVGRTLFHRTGRRLRLTEEGLLLYRESAQLIEEYARVLQRLDAAPEQRDPTLRLATFEVFSTHFLAGLFAAGLAEQPLQVLDLRIGEMERAVAAREADVGITYVPVPRRGLEFVSVASIEFGIFVRRDAFADVAFEALPFAIPAARLDHALSDVLGIDCWPYERIPRHVRYRLTSLESALQLCRQGRCAVFLPTFVAGFHNAHHPRRYQLSRRAAPHGLRRVTRKVHVFFRRDERARAQPLIDLVEAALRSGHDLARLATSGAQTARSRRRASAGPAIAL